MDDVAFELGLLKADHSSYISLLPIPILTMIKNYLKCNYRTEYIIWNNDHVYDVYTSRKPGLDDFFNFIKYYPLDRDYLLDNKIYWIVDYIFHKDSRDLTKKKQIDELMVNRHLLFDMLRKNKKYRLITRHIYECYKND